MSTQILESPFCWTSNAPQAQQQSKTCCEVLKLVESVMDASDGTNIYIYTFDNVNLCQKAIGCRDIKAIGSKAILQISMTAVLRQLGQMICILMPLGC